MAIIKRQVYGDLEQDLETAMRSSLDLMLEAVGLPDAQEGMRSYLEKRPPQFADYSQTEAS